MDIRCCPETSRDAKRVNRYYRIKVLSNAAGPYVPMLYSAKAQRVIRLSLCSVTRVDGFFICLNYPYVEVNGMDCDPGGSSQTLFINHIWGLFAIPFAFSAWCISR